MISLVNLGQEKPEDLVVQGLLLSSAGHPVNLRLIPQTNVMASSTKKLDHFRL